jgi:hypothetical protein
MLRHGKGRSFDVSHSEVTCYNCSGKGPSFVILSTQCTSPVMKKGAYGPQNSSNFYLSEQQDNETSVPSPQGSFQQLGGFGG